MNKKIILEVIDKYPNETACWEFSKESYTLMSADIYYFLSPSNFISNSSWTPSGLAQSNYLHDNGNGANIKLGKSRIIKLDYTDLAKLYILVSMYYKEIDQEMKLFEIKTL